LRDGEGIASGVSLTQCLSAGSLCGVLSAITSGGEPDRQQCNRERCRSLDDSREGRCAGRDSLALQLHENPREHGHGPDEPSEDYGRQPQGRLRA
jgi:hypothetical protein